MPVGERDTFAAWCLCFRAFAVGDNSVCRQSCTIVLQLVVQISETLFFRDFEEWLSSFGRENSITLAVLFVNVAPTSKTQYYFIAPSMNKMITCSIETVI